MHFLETSQVDTKKYKMVDKFIVVIPTSCQVKSKLGDYSPKIVQLEKENKPLLIEEKVSRAGQSERPYKSPVYYIEEGVRKLNIRAIALFCVWSNASQMKTYVSHETTL